jgi:CheY-like chemotaxis protein
VQDTGIGITQEQLAKLFKPFAQADETTQRSYGGSGLGLSICKALIAVLKGRIWLESQIGEGTTVSFTVTFLKTNGVSEDEKQISVRKTDPMATWSSDADGLASRPPSRQSNHLALLPRDQIRICIAEDNPINQKIAISFVRKLGFQCQAYSDGMQAVTALREASAKGDPFSLVLMDCQMPVLDGYDATRLIRKDKDPAVRDVLIIAMTASAIRGDREKCIEAGMNNYMAKPVRAQVLKEMLEEYMSTGQKQIPSLQEQAKNIEQKALEENNKETEATKRKEHRKEVAPLDLYGDANGVRSPPFLRSDTPVTARLDERPTIKKRGSSANTTILVTDHKEQELKALQETSNNSAQRD